MKSFPVAFALRVWLLTPLKAHSGWGSDLHRETFWTSKTNSQVKILDPEISASVDFDAAAKLVKEIKDARATLDELSERKQALGLKMTQTTTFFYLFPKRHGIEILELTTVEALEMWERGQHWLDMPQKTLPEAEQLKVQLLASGQR